MAYVMWHMQFYGFSNACQILSKSIQYLQRCVNERNSHVVAFVPHFDRCAQGWGQQESCGIRRFHLGMGNWVCIFQEYTRDGFCNCRIPAGMNSIMAGTLWECIELLMQYNDLITNARTRRD